MDIEWLRQKLALPGKSQRGLAAALGVDPAAVNRLLKGKRRPHLEEFSIFAAYLDVGIEEVISRLGGLPDLAPFPPGGLISKADSDLEAIKDGLLPTKSELPVWDAVSMNDTDFLLVDDPLFSMRRPFPLLFAESAYAFIMPNSSMSPVYEKGDMILVRSAPEVFWEGEYEGSTDFIMGIPHDRFRLICRLQRSSQIDYAEHIITTFQFSPKREFRYWYGEGIDEPPVGIEVVNRFDQVIGVYKNFSFPKRWL